MGVNMLTIIKSHVFRMSLLAFTATPLVLLWATGTFPERSLLKEGISVITILAFFQLIGQFFWVRTNSFSVRSLTMGRIVKYHKFIGYIFVLIMLFHPLYLVVPRYFESGVSPFYAFTTIITTMNLGVVLGIIAWCLMLILGLSSFVRSRLPMKYKTWLMTHGILAILFVATAVWHVIDIGRHSSPAMSIVLIMFAARGILHLLKAYTFKK